jgi:hypothetical protein
MAGTENPSESSKGAKPVETAMTPEQLKAYGDKRAQDFGSTGAQEKTATKTTPEEALAKTLQLAPDGSDLGKTQREFQFLVRKKYMAIRAGYPTNDAFDANYAMTLATLKVTDKSPANLAVYKQLQ